MIKMGAKVDVISEYFVIFLEKLNLVLDQNFGYYMVKNSNFLGKERYAKLTYFCISLITTPLKIYWIQAIKIETFVKH